MNVKLANQVNILINESKQILSFQTLTTSVLVHERWRTTLKSAFSISCLIIWVKSVSPIAKDASV